MRGGQRKHKTKCCFITFRNWGKDNSMNYYLLLSRESILNHPKKNRFLALSSQRNTSYRSTELIKLKYLHFGDWHQTKGINSCDHYTAGPLSQNSGDTNSWHRLLTYFRGWSLNVKNWSSLNFNNNSWVAFLLEKN